MDTYTYSLSDDKVIIPSSMQLATAQQEILKYQERAVTEPNSNASNVLKEKTQILTDLLKQDKERAKIRIDELVSSARQLTTELTTSLTAVPIHPYQRLLHEYLGPNFICPTIHELTIPTDFSPARCKAQIKQASKKMLEHELTQFQTLTAEIMDTSYEGVKTQNLNNAFAVLSSTAEGNQYVIDQEKFKQYLTFAETVKSMSIDYVRENSIIVAKKLLAEFTRIFGADLEPEASRSFNKESSPIEYAAKQSSKMLTDMLNKYDSENGTSAMSLVEQTARAKELFSNSKTEYSLEDDLVSRS
jgi:hypothetical protein